MDNKAAEIAKKAEAMLSEAGKEAKKRHPRVCRYALRSAGHAQAYMDCVARVGRELFPDFDQVVVEYAQRKWPQIVESDDTT